VQRVIGEGTKIQRTFRYAWNKSGVQLNRKHKQGTFVQGTIEQKNKHAGNNSTVNNGTENKHWETIMQETTY
jgi:hypothetical protein